MDPDATTDAPLLVAFVNTSSGRHLRRVETVQRIKDLCEGRATLRLVDSDASILEQVNQLPSGADIQLGILGGDGTHMRVMSSLLKIRGPERLPMLVSVPFGTVSTISRRWGTGNSPWRVLSAWLSREPMVLRRQPTLSITIDECDARCGCTVGTGLVAQFFEQYESMGGGGAGTAVRIAVLTFLSSLISSAYSRNIMKLLECNIAVDGVEIETRLFSLVVSSVFKDVGLGIRVTYRAGNELDRIALVTSSLPAGQLGPQFWRVLTGRPLVDPQGTNRLVHEWSLKFEHCGPVIIDGDRFSVASLRVRPGPVWSVLTPIRRSR